MTHDELLAEINKDIDQAAWVKDYYPVKMLQALRAVVELHKPNGRKCERCGENACWGCGEWGCGDDCDCTCHGIYPCPTIQAIERELA